MAAAAASVAAPAPAPAAPAPVAAVAPGAAPASAAPAAPGSRVFASPRARKLAHERGFDIGRVAATGPHGRVVAADVEAHVPLVEVVAAQAAQAPVTAVATPAAVSAPTAGDGFADYPVPEASRQIAARMTAAKQTVPHYYLTVDIEVSRAAVLRFVLGASPVLSCITYRLCPCSRWTLCSRPALS